MGSDQSLINSDEFDRQILKWEQDSANGTINRMKRRKLTTIAQESRETVISVNFVLFS